MTLIDDLKKAVEMTRQDYGLSEQDGDRQETSVKDPERSERKKPIQNEPLYSQNKIKALSEIVAIEQRKDAIAKHIPELREKIGEAIEQNTAYDDLLKELNESQEQLKQYDADIQHWRSTFICPKCGAEFDDDSIFCSTCGTRLKQEECAEEPKHE